MKWQEIEQLPRETLLALFQDSLRNLMRLDGYWFLEGEYRLELLYPQEAIFQMLECRAQQDRLKTGLGVFHCRGPEGSYFRSFAQAIIPNIEVSCAFAPPEKYWDNLWCQWQFQLKEAKRSHGRPHSIFVSASR